MLSRAGLRITGMKSQRTLDRNLFRVLFFMGKFVWIVASYLGLMSCVFLFWIDGTVEFSSHVIMASIWDVFADSDVCGWKS